MASVRNKNVIKINNSNNKLNNLNKNSSNYNSENAYNKENNNASNYIDKAFLADLLKCEICNNLFDLNTHIPMIAKCGHTFCKKCIIEKNLSNSQHIQYESCPLDNIQNIFNIESCIVNLRVELLIRKIFSNNISITTSSTSNPQVQQNINVNVNPKQIVYSKPDIKKTRNIPYNNLNINLNNQSPNKNNKNVEYGYIRLESESNKRYNDINDNLSSPQIEEEMNVNNENKFLFEDEKINGVIINETIDTIPIYDEKSFCNVSFKEDVNELFSKNNLANKQPLLTENIKKELNKNKYLANNGNKKKNKKKNIELDINQKPEISKMNTNFWLTPNKDKDGQVITNLVPEKKTSNIEKDKYNYIENFNKLNNKKILENYNSTGEEEDLTKYRNNTHQIRTVYDKIQLKLNEPLINNINYNYDSIEEKNINENIMKNNSDKIENNIKNPIVINRASNNENAKTKKDLYISTQYLPSKKIVLFSNSTTNNNSNNNRLSTNPNNNDKKIKTSVILNKNANIFSTQILKKNNNTIEAKNDKNYEEIIKSSAKKKSRNELNDFNGNGSYNENEIFGNKHKTYNSKKHDSIHNSLLDNMLNNSNKNNEVNKNIKILNKSNNNSSSFSNSNSNSVYNKKRIVTDSEINLPNLTNKNKDKENLSPLKQLISVTQKEGNNIFKQIKKNSKSQMFILTENNMSNNMKDIKEDENKLKSSVEKRKNNFVSHSTIIVKKPKNTSPIIFSTKHTNKNRIKIEMSYNTNTNMPKDNIEISLNEKNIRRANSFITNNNILNSTNNNNNSQNMSINKSQNEAFSNQLTNINCKTMPKKTKEEITQSLQNNLNSIIKRIKLKKNIDNLSKNKYQEMLEKIMSDPNYENVLEKITIKIFDNNDFFIGLMDDNNKYPLKGVLLSHNGDYYNGEFSEGKKDGNGSIIYKNGTRYEGAFKNDRHNGYGKLIQLDGEIFEGEWKNGKINGNGIRLHSNGDKYIGSYVNNIRNGQGHYIFINGDSYNGNWVNGKANGLGTFKFRNGNIYEGEFKDNLILGKGILTMHNGDVYIGVFTNGLLNGKGTFINHKGEKFIGVFEGGKKNGEGKLFDKSGKIIKEGIWKKDIFIDNK